jgi:hypothetical protein
MKKLRAACCFAATARRPGYANFPYDTGSENLSQANL